MDDFVPKPATLKDLSAAIERWDRPFDETALEVFSAVAAEGPGELAGLLSNFSADSEARLEAARAALMRGDYDVCRLEAHSIKGAAAAVGARGLTELCRRLETAAAKDSAGLLSQARAEAARVRAASSRRTTA